MSRIDELSALLRRLRADAALSGMEAARRAGYSQPKISRFETARQVPTDEEVRTLCRIYGATAGTVRARAVLSHGARYMQQRVGKIEQASELVRSFTPTIVDGLLQIPDYVRAMGSRDMAGADLDAFVVSRADRQQILDTDRSSRRSSLRARCAGTSALHRSWPPNWSTSSRPAIVPTSRGVRQTRRRVPGIGPSR